MLRPFGIKVVLLLACCLPVGMLWRTKAIETQPVEASAPEPAKTAAAKPLSPGPLDGTVANLTARLLERYHYRQHPFDDEISEKFLNRYLEAFDPQHIHFTEADVAEFEPYRHQLDDLTLDHRREADTTPAYKIFARFVERLGQHVFTEIGRFRVAGGANPASGLALTLSRTRSSSLTPMNASGLTAGRRRIRAILTRPNSSGGNACATNICWKSSDAAARNSPNQPP